MLALGFRRKGIRCYRYFSSASPFRDEYRRSFQDRHQKRRFASLGARYELPASAPLRIPQYSWAYRKRSSYSAITTANRTSLTMAFERADGLAALQIPEPECFLVRTGHRPSERCRLRWTERCRSRGGQRPKALNCQVVRDFVDLPPAAEQTSKDR
jgi:hypothetical protein